MNCQAISSSTGNPCRLSPRQNGYCHAHQGVYIATQITQRTRNNQ